MTTRYESRGGKYWVEVSEPDEHGLVTYRSSEGGGYVDARTFGSMLQKGYFQADDNTTPMAKVDR